MSYASGQSVAVTNTWNLVGKAADLKRRLTPTHVLPLAKRNRGVKCPRYHRARLRSARLFQLTLGAPIGVIKACYMPPSSPSSAPLCSAVVLKEEHLLKRMCKKTPIPTGVFMTRASEDAIVTLMRWPMSSPHPTNSRSVDKEVVKRKDLCNETWQIEADLLRPC